MKEAIISLSKTIVLDNGEKAKANFLEDFYNSFFSDLKETLSWHYRGHYKTSDNLTKDMLTKIINEHFKPLETKLHSLLSKRDLFNSNSLVSISLKEVLLRINSFDLNNNKFNFTIHLSSVDLRLLDTIGNFVIVSPILDKSPDYIDTVSLELGSDLLISKVKL